MNREILFRGKRLYDGEWIDGYYVRFCYSSKARESHRIYTGYVETDCGELYPDSYKVDPLTVGQFTGLTAYWETLENEQEEEDVWEHDLLEVTCEGKEIVAEVKFEAGMFILCSNEFCDGYIPLFNFTSVDDVCYINAKKIGNIHDNPELLKEGERHED